MRRLADCTRGWGRNKPLPAVVATYVTRWQTDSFAHGAYSFLPVGAAPADRAALAEPSGTMGGADQVRNSGKENVACCFWCGEATHLRYPATVHGAYLSGLEAAARVCKQKAVPVPADTAATLAKEAKRAMSEAEQSSSSSSSSDEE